MSALVHATSSPEAPSIPAPQPGVERSYAETFQLLASDDEDPYYSTSSFESLEYDPESGVTRVNRTLGTLPLELRLWNLRPTEALTLAYATDVYTLTLNGELSSIPYRDVWIPLTDHPAVRLGYGYRVIPLNEYTEGTATSTDGRYRVEALNQYGDWDPVYRATVAKAGDGELVVTNPDTALVHVPAGQLVVLRKIDALQALLQYSELAPTPEAARSEAVIPMQDGVEVFPTRDGASTSLVWRDGTHNLVQDAYVGVMDVPPGVWYRGHYVTQSHQVNAYVPWDYRITPPSDYLEEDTCTIEETRTYNHVHRTDHTHSIRHIHPLPNGGWRIHYHEWTHVHETIHEHTVTEKTTYTRTKWAEYQIIGSNASVVDVSIDGTPMFRLGDQAGIWSTFDDQTPAFHRLPPGEYTLTATLQVDAKLKKRYGVRSENCPTWEESTTETKSMTTSYSVPIRTVDAESAGLSVDVTVFDKPGNDIIVLNWTGDQRLTANPWADVTITLGQKTMRVTSPWHFYSVSRNTHIEERTANGIERVAASHSWNGTYPAMVHNQVSVANVTVQLHEHAEQRSWWRPIHTVSSRSVPASSLAETVIAPENEPPTELYTQYAGTLRSTDEAWDEPVAVSSRSIFDISIVNTSAETVRYHNSTLDLWTNETDTATLVSVRLTDTKTGLPLPDRSIAFSGANTSSVTTGPDGTATVRATGAVIIAAFEGDSWQHPRETYYLGSRAGTATAVSFLGAAGSVFEYIDTAVSNTLIIVEWITLGLFALYWLRFRNPNRAGE